MKKALKMPLIIVGITAAVFLVINIFSSARVNYVTNAVVNENNGDVAFCYYDSSGRVGVIKVELFNRSGERLFSKSLFTEGSYAALMFYNDSLCVNCGRLTTKFYAYNRDGEDSKAEIPGDIIEAVEKYSSTEEQWKGFLGKYTYAKNGVEYVWEDYMFFIHRARIIIRDGDKEIVIYEST